MTRNALWLASLSILAAGCIGTGDDTGGDDTGSTYYEGPWQIASYLVSCDDNGTTNTTFDNRADATSDHNDDEWTFDVVTDGLAGTIELQIAETGAYNDTTNTMNGIVETHLLDDNYDYDLETGTYDKWKLVLARTNDYANYSPGDPNNTGDGTTFFSCWWDDATKITDTDGYVTEWQGGSLAFMFTMYDDSSPPEQQDCIYFGRKAYQYFNTREGNDCLCFEGDGSDSYCQD